jgi:hypothetical protein
LPPDSGRSLKVNARLFEIAIPQVIASEADRLGEEDLTRRHEAAEVREVVWGFLFEAWQLCSRISLCHSAGYTRPTYTGRVAGWWETEVHALFRRCSLLSRT